MVKRSQRPTERDLVRLQRAIGVALSALAEVVTQVRRLGEPNETAKRVASKPPLSRKRRAALKLHGAYIGHLRHLNPRQKAQVQAMKAKKGYEAAIKMATRLAGK